MKKFYLFLIILCLAVNVFAIGITNYSVPEEVNLGNNVTASGIYTNDLNSGVLCSFYFYDAMTGVLVDRATDQYTTSSGRFTMPFFPINEPVFKRNSVYTLVSECGTSSADANFLVIQRETLAFYGQQEFNYLTNQGNTDTIFIWGVMILILIVFIFAGISLKKYAGGR